MLTINGNRRKTLSHLPQKMPVLYLLSFVAITAAIWMAFCSSTSAQVTDILTPEERLWLEEHDGKITLAPTPNYPPVDFFDNRGRETGMAGDYIHLIERKLGFRFKVVRLDSWADIVQAAKKRKIDVTSIAQRTPARDEFWLFTKPYLTVPTVIISSNRIKGRLSLGSLDGQRVAVVRSYGITEYISREYPDLRLESVPNDLTGLRRVSVGDLDAMIADLPTAAYLIEKEGITNLRVAGETGFSYHYSIASRKDLPILNRILNKGLAAITPTEREAISNKWVRLRIVRSFDWRLAWMITTLILGIVLAVLIWNVGLRQRVRAQTEELIIANTEIQERETRFRNMVQNIPGVVYQLRVRRDGSTQLTYVSTRATDIFGLSSDPSHPDWELGRRIHPDDKERFFSSVKEAIDNQAPWNFEGRLVLPDGSVRHIRGTASPTKIGNQLVFDGILLDITERELTQEMLLQSERQFRDLIELIPIGVVVHTAETIRYVNPQAIEVAHAKDSEEMVGRSIWDFIHPSWRDNYRNRLKAVTAEGLKRLPLVEGTLMAIDGTRVEMEGASAPVVFGGEPSVLSVFRDITERKRSEKALYESEQRYRAIFDSTAYAFILFDLEGKIIDANARACQMYGYSSEEIVGMPGQNLVDPDYRHLFRQFLQIKTGEWFAVESVEVRKDGSRFDSEVYGTRIYYLGNEQLLSVVSDVTERNRARAAMKTYEDIVHNMQSGLYVYHLEDPKDDHSLRLVDANPTSTAALGIVKEDVLGKYIDEVFPGLRERGIPKRFAETAITGQPFSVDDFLYSDGTINRRYFSFRVFALPGNRVGVLFEDTTEEKQAEIEKRQFYRDTISSVTDGKLLMASGSECALYISRADLTIDVNSYEDTVSARRAVAAYFGEYAPLGSDFTLFMTGFGEAMTNAIKHAGSGKVYVGTQGGSLWACVTDEGPGIAALALPKATLRRGYSTKVSMGMGYSIMIEASDQIMLCTGPEGTTVILLKNLLREEPQIRLEDLPDTW